MKPKSGSLSSLSKGQSVAPRPGAGTILGPGGKPIMGSGIDAFRGGTPGRAPSIPKPKPLAARPKFKFKGKRGGILGILGFAALDFFMTDIQDIMVKILEKVDIGIGAMSDEKLLKEYKNSIEAFGQSNEDFGPADNRRILLREIQRRELSFNRGGTVPGKGSGSVDSVRAMLAPGEEVVKTASARLFRPLLKDINDNAGRLWSAFSMGIDKLMMVSKQQEDVNKEFARVIEDQEKYQRDLKTEKILKKVEGRGGGYRSPAKITPKAPRGGGNISMIPQSSGGMIFQPMVLPTQRSKPPQIPEMSGPATQAPNIAAANPANPYMMLTPELYGIMV